MTHHTTTLNLFCEDDESIGRICQYKHHGNFMCKLPQFMLSER